MRVAPLRAEALQDVEGRGVLREDDNAVLAGQQPQQQPVEDAQLAARLGEPLGHGGGGLLEAVEEQGSNQEQSEATRSSLAYSRPSKSKGRG